MEKFLLRPESDSEFEQWKRILENSREKKLFLYFHAEVVDEQDRDATFLNTDRSEGIQNFANSDGQYFEVGNGENMTILENTNGNFYNYEGLFLAKVSGKQNGIATDVYVCEEKGDRDNTFIGAKKLNTKYDDFIKHASTAYGESSVAYNVIDKYEIFAIASVHKRNKVAFGVNSDFAVQFRNLTDIQRNQKVAMKYAIAGEINALLGGTDYSNGAKQWDGAEQTHLPANKDISSNGKFMFKVNVMGWDITDELYNSWKKAVTNKFGQTYFNAPQRKFAVSNYKGMTNKGKIRLKSVAQYGITMFWKEVIINKLFFFLTLMTSLQFFSQNIKLDRLNFNDLKFNTNSFITEFSKIKKYIDPSKTKGNVFLENEIDYPFLSISQNDIVYLVRNKWLSFYYLESNPKLVYLQNVLPNNKMILTLKKLRLIQNLKVENLGKIFRNSYLEYKKSNPTALNEKKLKLVLRQGKKYGILNLCFVNGKFSYLMIEK